MTDFHRTTTENEAALKAAIAANPAKREELQARYDALLQIPDERCAVSKTQREFLGKVLGIY